MSRNPLVQEFEMGNLRGEDDPPPNKITVDLITLHAKLVSARKVLSNLSESKTEEESTKISTEALFDIETMKVLKLQSYVDAMYLQSENALPILKRCRQLNEETVFDMWNKIAIEYEKVHMITNEQKSASVFLELHFQS